MQGCANEKPFCAKSILKGCADEGANKRPVAGNAPAPKADDAKLPAPS
jgi:hypothetical protein